MKTKKLIFMVILLAMGSMCWGQTLDVKTKFSEKLQLTSLKLGVDSFLMKRGAYLSEVGEDYAVWITDRQSEKNGTTKTVSVEIYIAGTDAFGMNRTLTGKHVSFSFNTEKAEEFTTDDATTVFIRSKLLKKGKEAFLEGSVGGKIVADAVFELLNSLPNKKYR